MKNLYYILVYCILTIASNAQDTTLHVRDTLCVSLTVFDSEEKAELDKPLRGASVALQYKGQVLFSDTTSSDGKFKFAVLIDDTSSYTLVVSKDGFTSKSIIISSETENIPTDTAFEVSVNFQLFRKVTFNSALSGAKPVGRIYYNPISNSFEREILH